MSPKDFNKIIQNSWTTGKITKNDFNFSDDVCLFLKEENGDSYIIDKDNIKKPNSNREIFNMLKPYSTIITDCYFKSPFNSNGYEKKIFRKEIIENIFSSYHTHFLDDDLFFTYEDNNVFLVEEFYNKYKENDYLIFCSDLLNSLEYGMVFDNIKLKPTINISDYGRWYFSNIKVQNNKKERQKIIDNLKKYGTIISVDLISGEPSLFQKLTNSEMINMLIALRRFGKYDNPRIKIMIKDLLNIYLHSIKSPKESFEWFKNTNKDYKELEKVLGIKIIDIYYSIEKETDEYNRKVLNDYASKLYTTEFDRRIVNPDYNYLNEQEVIKEHRKVLQGHTQDAILKILFELYKNDKIKISNILWTIFDSFTIMVQENISDDIKLVSNKLDYAVDITIEN